MPILFRVTAAELRDHWLSKARVLRDKKAKCEGHLKDEADAELRDRFDQLALDYEIDAAHLEDLARRLVDQVYELTLGELREAWSARAA